MQRYLASHRSEGHQYPWRNRRASGQPRSVFTLYLPTEPATPV